MAPCFDNRSPLPKWRGGLPIEVHRMLKEWIKGVTARLRDKLRGMLQRRPVWHPSTSAPPCNLSADLAIRSRTAAALHLQSWRATSCVRPRRSRSSDHSFARCWLPHMSYKAATTTLWQFVNRNLINKDTFIAKRPEVKERSIPV